MRVRWDAAENSDESKRDLKKVEWLYLEFASQRISRMNSQGDLLIQFKDAGHALPGQYPDKMNKILQTFLATTNTTTTVQPE